MLRVKRDDGTVAVVAAVVVSFLVLPLLAIVIDVGAMFVERRQLQHSADSAATAVAQACKDNKVECDVDTVLAYADTFANPNDSRGVSVVKVCGNYVNPADSTQYLDDCGTYPVADTLRQYGYKYWCDTPPTDDTIQYVEVHVESAPGFAGRISGNEGKINACGRALVNPAKVVWTTPAPIPHPGFTPPPIVHPGFTPPPSVSPGSGNPSTANVLALTMSLCDWEIATSYHTRYNVSTDITFPTTHASCPPYVSPGSINNSANGGLDQAKPSGTGIQLGVQSNTWVSTGPGNSNNWNGLDSVIAANPGKIWLIPLFDKTIGTGSSLQYHIVGFAAFVITAGNGHAGHVNGYFTTYTCSSTSECSGLGGDYGVTTPSTTYYPSPSPGWTEYPSPSPGWTETFPPSPSTSPGTAHNVP